ncbi:unnamed protein product [Owenia fusiformis]|uniref:Uncharacterized protein n=1 Tax=Owenia fusiformis TaxID=6347 RepID=A0A8S4N6L6_OWEFU|nr:unnamed protein product [Owenia fusiformis]
MNSASKMWRGRTLISVMILTMVVILVLCMHASWENDVNEKVKYQQGFKLLQNYGKEIGNKSTVPQCNVESRNLIGYEEKNRDNSLIIYSKMPKCGSSTLVLVFLETRKIIKHYTIKRVKPHPRVEELQSDNQKKKYITTRILPRRPYIYMGHISFLNFEELGFMQPLYIDMVREPIERIISLFYFSLEPGPDSVHVKRYNLTQSDMNKTIEECIQLWINETRCFGKSIEDTAECLKSRPHQGCKVAPVEYKYPVWFSGQYTNLSLVSVERAKTNIEKYYTFIGLTENFSDSLMALDTILPGYTNELSNAYRSLKKNKNVGKKEKVRPSDQSISLLKILLKDDFELYRFVRQRFYIHLKCLDINMTYHV